jgi:hypothetical protein
VTANLIYEQYEVGKLGIILSRTVNDLMLGIDILMKSPAPFFFNMRPMLN